MKKYLWFWLFSFLFLPGQARPLDDPDEFSRRHELSLAYGILPITGWMDSFAGLFTDKSGFASGRSHTSGWGAVSICYNFSMNRKVAFGGMYTCSGMKEVVASGNGPTGKFSTRFHTVMPVLKFSWYSRPKVLLYTRAGIGIVISTQQESGFVEKTYSRKNAYLAWQCSPVGIEVGTGFAGFAEIGIGNAGLLSAGLRYRF